MRIQLEKMGWVVSAALLATIVGTGFQAKSDKVGIVDMGSLMTRSDLVTAGRNNLQTAYKQRQDVLEFVQTYPVFTTQQANRFRELSLKANLTAAEKTELDKIKNDVKDADGKFTALQQKQNPTAADSQQLAEFGRRGQELSTLLQQWRQQFNDELTKQQEDNQSAAVQRAKESINEIGKAQGFTLIFVKDVAPYAQNEITNDALKAMNAKK